MQAIVWPIFYHLLNYENKYCLMVRIYSCWIKLFKLLDKILYIPINQTRLLAIFILGIYFLFNIRAFILKKQQKTYHS